MTMRLAAEWQTRMKLRAEGSKLWAEAILTTYGNIRLEWVLRGDDYDCWIDADGGVTYRHDVADGAGGQGGGTAG
jgi:hypothetical protein